MPIERYTVAAGPHRLTFLPTGQEPEPVLTLKEALAVVEGVEWPGEGTPTGWAPYAFRVGKTAAATALVEHLKGLRK